MSKYKEYDYVIVGAGIAGCSLAYFLSKHSKSVLLLEKNDDVAFGASGAAGAFLSPLLGKPNKFKDLITKSLSFSTEFYKSEFPDDISSCGTCRIPKNNEDREKFESYKPYMDFDYKEFEDGYLFEIGSVVNSYNICKKLTENSEVNFDYEVENIKKDNENWILNDEILARKLFLTTGADISLLEEEYFNIRAVWGQKISIHSTTCIDINYHKECSLSRSSKIEGSSKNLISIGATHNRFTEDMTNSSYSLSLKNINKTEHNTLTKSIMNEDTKKLLSLASDIKKLDDVEVVDIKIGARASSVDYFPMLGRLVDSKNTISSSPHIVNGSFIKDEQLVFIDNLFVLNGVGGRGFVLSPYLANELVEHVINKKEISEEISTSRLFKRWVKKSGKNKK